MQKNKALLGLVMFILIISFVFLRVGKQNSKTELYKYLPQLRKYDLYDVNIKKIYADASYKIPYNLLISFKSNTENIFEDLGLKNLHMVDTIKLRKSIWIEEYDIYFTMKSLNAIRYKSIKDEEKGIKWWKVINCINNYAAPYIDKGNERRIVQFGEQNNGRVVCCKTNNTYYLLIECWG